MIPPISTKSPVQTEAATKIQSLYRGYTARKLAKFERKVILPLSLFEQAKPLIDDESGVKKLPRAFNGGSLVFLPKKVPLVIKKTDTNAVRLSNMRLARTICEQQGYTRLTIPRARLDVGYIIEDRIPIGLDFPKSQIGFYREHQAACTEAIKEFTHFCCHAQMDDLISKNETWSTIGYSGRYDNVPLYQDNGQIKIALIDLEYFSHIAPTPRQCLKNLETVVTLFPHHADEILQIGEQYIKKLSPEEREKGLHSIETARKNSLQLFQHIYENHVTFLKKNGITTENPTKLVAISSERMEEICQAVDHFLTDHNDCFYEGCLGTSPQEALDDVRKKVPLIVERIQQFLESAIHKSIAGMNLDVQHVAFSDLSQIRTFFVQHNFNLHISLRSFVEAQLEKLSFSDKDEKRRFATKLLDHIFSELSGKEIAYFNRSSCLEHIIFC